jgi:hypothetical protein
LPVQDWEQQIWVELPTVGSQLLLLHSAPLPLQGWRTLRRQSPRAPLHWRPLLQVLSVWPAAMATHRPVLGSQRSQVPLHACWQQTPSVQVEPAWHCWLLVHGSPAWRRQSLPEATWPSSQTQLPFSAHTLPSAAQLREQQREAPPTSGWQMLGAAHWPASHGKPSGGRALQPPPGVQPLAHSTRAMTPALQRSSLLPSQLTASPSQATHALPSLLQNEPSEQALLQQTLVPSALAVQMPEAHCSAPVQAAPGRRRQAALAGSHSHSASGRSAS